MMKVNMNITDVRQAIAAGAQALINAEALLTELDSKTGDGDHGLTMKKIGERFMQYGQTDDSSTAGSFFSGLAEAVLSINGGSIVSIWAEMMFGVADALGSKDSFCQSDILVAIDGAINGIGGISSAKPGDKTLVDTLYAVKTVCMESADEKNDAAFYAKLQQAAADGAEATKDMVSKFGRAKQLVNDSVGYLDPGAVSMSLFLKGIAAYLNAH